MEGELSDEVGLFVLFDPVEQAANETATAAIIKVFVR